MRAKLFDDKMIICCTKEQKEKWSAEAKEKSMDLSSFVRQKLSKK